MSASHQYRKVMKPLLERKRRARINGCLDELKELMEYLGAESGQRLARLEKADVLEVTVLDDDENKKKDFLGKVEIPLLKVRSGEKKWYRLKNEKLNDEAKGGDNARVLLEMDLYWNPIRAFINTFENRDIKHMETPTEHCFKFATFSRQLGEGLGWTNVQPRLMLVWACLNLYPDHHFTRGRGRTLGQGHCH